MKAFLTGWLFFILAVTLAGCAGSLSSTKPPPAVLTAAPAPTASQQSSPTHQPVSYAFPASIDLAQRYLFYLHGKIIEDQGLPAISPEYGEYEYCAILERLARDGISVISEQRPKDTDSGDYAQHIVEQIMTLLQAGVPPENITVVGASHGARIAILTSFLLKNTKANFVLLGTCHPDTVAELRRNQVTLYGNVLSIYNSADTEFSGSCASLFAYSDGKGLGRRSEIVLQVGTGHGILYKPLDEWVIPVIEWANMRNK